MLTPLPCRGPPRPGPSAALKLLTPLGHRRYWRGEAGGPATLATRGNLAPCAAEARLIGLAHLLLKPRRVCAMELVIGVGVLLAIVAFALGRVRDAKLAERIGKEVRNRDDNDDR